MSEGKAVGTEGVVGLTQWFKKMESVFHISNCTVACQIKFATCILQENALTWWNSHVKTFSHEIAYGRTWKALKKIMTDKYCLRGEIKKLEIELMFHKESDKFEKYVGGLPDMIQGTQQQPPKKQSVAIAYTVGSSERKEYAGTLLLCNKCKFHHTGPYTRTFTFDKRGNQGHYRNDCLELKNQNHGNQARGTKARGMVYALGGGEADQDLDNIEVDINHNSKFFGNSPWYSSEISIVMYE
ncbi:hypothetical protein Tco_0391032 [Tanacetum coccineum]